MQTMKQVQQQKQKQPQGQRQQQQQPKKENVHQNLLVQTAHERGWKLRVALVDGRELEGVLVGHDNFSFTLKLPDDRVVCFFKHVIASFEVVVPS